MIKTVLAFGLVVGLASPAWPATRYVALTGNDAVDCTGGENIATPLRTLEKATQCSVAGDTTFIRDGIWNERIDLQGNNKTGTASGGYIAFKGYPGERPVLKYTDTGSYGAIKARGSRGYFIFENLVIDGSNYTYDVTNWRIETTNHHFILRNIEIKNTGTSGIIILGDDITVEDSHFHDTISTACTDGTRNYGIYLYSGSRVTIQRNRMNQNPGGGLQVYPGPFTDVVISDNDIYNNGSCPGTDHGGMVLFTSSSGGPGLNVKIYNNKIHDNGQAGYGGPGTGGNTGGTGHGIRVTNSNATALSGVKINNNTIYNNFGGSTKAAYGIELQTGANNIEVKNNIVLNNEDGQIHNTGTGNTIENNACKSVDFCGTTGKVTVTAITDMTISTSDFRLKQGTNPARDAGATVTTRPFAVGLPDIGAYEQGVVASATANDGLDVVVNTASGTIDPTTSLTGLTVACVGCTGTPVVASGALKAGTGSTIHLVLSGIITPGSCTVSIGATNVTDGALIGGVAQGINSATAFSVSGTCANSGALGIPSGAIAYYKLNEGTGVIAGDETTNNFDALFPPQITWTTVYSGSGLRVPNDGAFHSLVVPFGASTNMATAAGATCAIVKPDATLAQKVVFSSGGNGANQRLYYGWATVGGELQWGIGIQGSGFTTGSEFPVTSALTSVCLTWSGGTATLWVNGVKGTQSGKSIKTYGSYVTVPSNFEYGGDGTNVTNSGGYDLDEIVFWSTLPSDGVLQAYHTDRFIPGAAATCYAQVAHQVQLSHLYGGAATNYGYLSAPVDVIAGGSAAVIFQIDCTGSAGSSISVVPYYADLQGGPFTSPVPLSAGGAGIGMYGSASAVALNAGTVSGNLVGALTNIPGVTVYLSNASQDILLAEDQSKVVRYLFTFGEIEGQTRCVALKQGGGTALAGGVTPSEGACFRIVPRAVMVP